MAAITSLVIAGVGLATAGVGTYMNYKAGKEMQAAQEKQIGIQQEMERKRNQQMNLDAMRRRREIVRQSIAARSQALAATTAAGASGGSALPGAYAGYSGRTNVNDLGVRQNQEIGNAMFGLNAQLGGAYRDAAAAQSGAAFGAGLSSLGGAIMNASGQISKIGGAVAGRVSAASWIPAPRAVA